MKAKLQLLLDIAAFIGIALCIIFGHDQLSEETKRECGVGNEYP